MSDVIIGLLAAIASFSLGFGGYLAAVRSSGFFADRALALAVLLAIVPWIVVVAVQRSVRANE